MGKNSPNVGKALYIQVKANRSPKTFNTKRSSLLIQKDLCKKNKERSLKTAREK